MSADIKKCRGVKPDQTGRVLLAQHFLCSGTTGLLLAIPHFYPQVWFLSFIAFIPFLWRVSKAGFSDALILGTILALSYCFVMAPLVSWAEPGKMALKILVFTILFVCYAGIVNRVARRIGLQAVFIAVLWLPIEYGLNRLSGISHIFALPENDSGMIIRVGTIFGMLMISFIIVLANILILLLLREIARICGCELKLALDVKRPFFFFHNDRPCQKALNYTAIPRAPPYPNICHWQGGRATPVLRIKLGMSFTLRVTS